MKVYIDTSVIGGCFDKEFQVWSNALFKEFNQGTKIAVISDVTIQELENAPDFVRELLNGTREEYKEIILADERVISLANAYINEDVVSEAFFNDAMHIALATINKVDVLVSWNFKHIVNFNKIRLYNSVNLKLGYSLIDIRTPREVLSEK